MDLTYEPYIQELDGIKQTMLAAEELAAKFPMFAQDILKDKRHIFRGYVQLSQKYKTMPLNWGINYALYGAAYRQTPVNYKEKINKPIWLFDIHININDLFHIYPNNNYNLENIVDKVDIFFYDKSNTTFYVTEDNLEDLLEALLSWYETTKVKIAKEAKADKIAKLEKELAALKES